MPIVPETDPRSAWFVSCDEIFGVKRGTVYSMEGRRDYERRFLVVTKTKELHPNSVALCPYLPLPGSEYRTNDDYDLLALLIRIDVSEAGPAQDDYTNWIVTCSYSTDIPTRGGVPDNIGFASSPGGSQNNPDIEFPAVSWDNEIANVRVYKDLDGRFMENSAHEPIVPTPTIEVGYPVLQITRNEYGYNALKAAEWMFKVNDNWFLGYPQECVQCVKISATQEWRGKLRFFKVTYRLRFNRRRKEIDTSTNKPFDAFVSWNPEYLDEGTDELDPPNRYSDEKRLDDEAQVRAGLIPPHPPQKLVPIFEEVGGMRVSSPKLLDGRGAKLEKDADGFKKPVFLYRRIYESRPFNELIVKGVS